jgi:pyrroline-5-carboxylate reductase
MKRQLIDSVTAVSGSGPAYFFYVMEAMIAAGQELGLDEKTARALTLQTALGSAQMAITADVSALMSYVVVSPLKVEQLNKPLLLLMMPPCRYI